MTAERMAVAFGRVLRGAGMRVPLDSVVTFVQCLDAVGITDRNRVYWAAHSALVRRPEDREAFNVAFAVFWERLSAGDDPETIGAESLTLAVDAEDGDGSGEANDDPAVTLRFSATETLRSKDFADYTTDELAEAQRLMARLRFAGSPRQSQRLSPSRTRTARVDVRRTVRSSFAHLGEPVRREWREPSEKLRRLVVLLDVSGSMEPYARAFLRFMHAAMVGRQRVEAFTLGTRLTRVTRELTHRDPDKALMHRLARVAHRVVWVNPLKVTPGYAPLARGMAAALPHVDAFVEGHSLAALEHLTAVIHDDARVDARSMQSARSMQRTGS
ncbi:MAG: VWA domain-containing protein [Actinobacteria bacterium]|nr:VWA domain-containing protein [Actinomycetota bacterium]